MKKEEKEEEEEKKKKGEGRGRRINRKAYWKIRIIWERNGKEEQKSWGKLAMAIEQYFKVASQFYLCSLVVNSKFSWPFLLQGHCYF